MKVQVSSDPDGSEGAFSPQLHTRPRNTSLGTAVEGTLHSCVYPIWSAHRSVQNGRSLTENSPTSFLVRLFTFRLASSAEPIASDVRSPPGTAFSSARGQTGHRLCPAFAVGSKRTFAGAALVADLVLGQGRFGPNRTFGRRAAFSSRIPRG